MKEKREEIFGYIPLTCFEKVRRVARGLLRWK